jgi:rhodanese-related sulfurtransferase
VNMLLPSRAAVASTTPQAVREALRAGHEIALLDVREEAPFAAGHPLFAVNVPLGRIEERIAALIPRRTAPVVVYDAGENLAPYAADLLRELGYSTVSLLQGGLEGWRQSGGEVFVDVNVPSKAFGELVEHVRHTPSLPAEEVYARLSRKEDMVILDARRFSEYTTMSIPQGRSVPGAELALRVRDLAPSPTTTVIVNCAGRTRSIIGAQSLVNAAIPNPVYALRNGTIGWTLAGFELAHGATLGTGELTPANHAAARDRAQALALATGVEITSPEALSRLEADSTRTLYRLDVRSPAEYEAGHLAGFRSAPGGQLVQATDEWAAVRHATLVLTDTDGVRARMTAHWLRQLGWRHVYVLDDWADLPRASGAEPATHPRPLSRTPELTPHALAAELASPHPPLLIDVANSSDFAKAHIPEAFFLIPSVLSLPPSAWPEPLRDAHDIVVTSPDGVAARIAAATLKTQARHARVLAGGTRHWQAEGLEVNKGLPEERLLSRPLDVYKRPYEGTDNANAAMQAYLDWEFGLVAQLECDGTHGFTIYTPEDQSLTDTGEA